MKKVKHLTANRLGVKFGLAVDQRNFNICFQHIDDILKALVNDLDEQLSEEHMNYDVVWDNETTMCFNSETKKEERELFIELLLSEALSSSMKKAMGDVDVDPWSIIKGVMALRVSKKAVQSPISAQEYEEIKVAAKKSVPLDMDSVYVNNEMPGWTEEKQIELLLRKEKNESSEMVAKQDKI